jgi:DNA-binding MarR family transcriptional regulator
MKEGGKDCNRIIPIRIILKAFDGMSAFRKGPIAKNQKAPSVGAMNPRIVGIDDNQMSEVSSAGLPIDAPERRRLPPLLRRAWYGLNQAFRRRILHLKITPDQFTVLRTLIEAEPKGLSQREIAETISSDPNTIASLLERMEANQMVERTKHETDRRAHRIRLLAHGRKTYKIVRALALELQSEVLSALPEQEREGFLKNLAVVADACHRAAEDSPKKGL